MPPRAARHGARVEKLQTSAYTIPTDRPEADGTLRWDSTTLVLVEVWAGGVKGLGYTYGDAACARFIDSMLADVIVGMDAMDIPRIWHCMVVAIRNQGRPGVGSMSIAAVDIAMWDLKSRLLDLALVDLLGAARDAIPVYGSGGFTSYPDGVLEEQLAAWVEAGIGAVKIKVGSEPDRDPERVARAREAIGPGAALMVDGNGAFGRKQALVLAERFAGSGVCWFEEPVSSEDLAGLRLLRDRVPAPMLVTAGEYGYHLSYFRRMLEAQAVDVLQADATRCAGITGFRGVGALCDAFEIPLSAHTAPALHLHVCSAVPAARDIEYFHDHVRIEDILFDGVVKPAAGKLVPDRDRAGHGLVFKAQDATPYRVAA